MALNRSKLIRRIVYVLVGGVILAFIVTRFFGGTPEPNYTTEKVVKGNVEQTVEITGTTESQNRYQLQFPVSGRINSILVEEGQKVKSGDMLATLENGDLLIQLESQKAGLKITQSNLAKVLAGPKNEERELNKYKVELAQVDFNTSQQSRQNLLALAKKNIESAYLSLRQAEENYNQARNTLNYTRENSILSQDQSQISYRIANLGVDQSREDINFSSISNTQSINQAKENLEIKFQSLIQSGKNGLEIAANVTGINGSSTLPDSDANQILDEIIYFYDQAVDAVNDFENEAENINSSSSYGEIEEAYQRAKNAYEELYQLIVELKRSVNNLQINEQNTQQINTLQQVIDAAFQSIQQNFQSLQQNFQSLQTLQDKSEYNESSGDIAYQIKENNADISSLQYQQVKLGEQKKISDAQNAITQASIALSQARENYNKALIEYNRQADDLNSNVQKAQIGVKTAQTQQKLAENVNRESDIAPLKAQIDQAWEGVKLAEYRLSQTLLQSPVNGKIVDIQGDIGENANFGQTLITLDSDGFVIKALVSEADIAKINVGNKVNLDFDAFGSDQKFEGEVIWISLSESVIQGVVYYEIKVQFDPKDQNVRPGMTANMTIQTNTSENVLKIPLQAVEFEDEKAYVRVLITDEKGKKSEERREVTLGLEGDQEVEILSGLNENEEVITFMEENK